MENGSSKKIKEFSQLVLNIVENIAIDLNTPLNTTVQNLL